MAQNTIQSKPKEQIGDSMVTPNNIPCEQAPECTHSVQKETHADATIHDTIPEFVSADPTTDEGLQVDQHIKLAGEMTAASTLSTGTTPTTPSGNGPDTETNITGEGIAHTPQITFSVPQSAEPDAGIDREGLEVDQFSIARTRSWDWCLTICMYLLRFLTLKEPINN